MSEVKAKKTRWLQYSSAAIVCLANLCNGWVIGWPSGALVYLQSENSHVLITPNEALWLVQAAMLSSIIFTPFSSYLADLIGRKKTVILFCVPQTIGLCILATMSSANWFIFARFLIGIQSALSIVPAMYIAEIADMDIRGGLMTFFNFFFFFGVLLSYAANFVLSYKTQCAVGGLFPIATCILTMFIPESPFYYVKIGKYKKAREVLVRFKGTDDVNESLNQIKSELVGTTAKISNIFTQKGLRTALLTAFYILFCEQFTAINGMITYCETVVIQSGFTALPSASIGIWMQVLLLICSSLGFYITDKLGKKPIYIFSLFGSATTLGVLAVYFYLKEYYLTPENLSSVTWLPFICMCLYICMFVVGVGNLSSTTVTEYFPLEYKQHSISLINVYYQIVIAISTLLFEAINRLYGNYALFAVFATCSFVNVIGVLRFMPETANRPLSEVYKWFGIRMNKSQLEKVPYKTLNLQQVTYTVARTEPETVDPMGPNTWSLGQ